MTPKRWNIYVKGVLEETMKFFSSEVALYLQKSTIRSRMEHYCHVWGGASNCNLNMLDKLHK